MSYSEYPDHRQNLAVRRPIYFFPNAQLVHRFELLLDHLAEAAKRFEYLLLRLEQIDECEPREVVQEDDEVPVVLRITDADDSRTICVDALERFGCSQVNLIE